MQFWKMTEEDVLGSADVWLIFSMVDYLPPLLLSGRKEKMGISVCVHAKPDVRDGEPEEILEQSGLEKSVSGWRES